jgi:ferritin-like metal-binding protein YciE
MLITMATKKPADKINAKKTASGAARGNSQLEKLFIDSLKDLYWAEKALTKALPKMQEAATTEELKAAIEEHLGQTQEHVTRLEEVFGLFDKKAQAKKCDGMEGLIKEGEIVVEETEEGSMTRDAGIIMSAQKVEHYEISAYGTLVQLAKTLGNDKAAGILQTTLDEEKQTDQGLTAIAESGINWEAEMEPVQDEEDEKQLTIGSRRTRLSFFFKAV